MTKVKLKTDYVQGKLLRRNISQGNFAQRIAVSGGYCSQLMSGERCPSPKVRVEIMRELDAPFEDVFEVMA